MRVVNRSPECIVSPCFIHIATLCYRYSCSSARILNNALLRSQLLMIPNCAFTFTVICCSCSCCFCCNLARFSAASSATRSTNIRSVSTQHAAAVCACNAASASMLRPLGATSLTSPHFLPTLPALLRCATSPSAREREAGSPLAIRPAGVAAGACPSRAPPAAPPWHCCTRTARRLRAAHAWVVSRGVQAGRSGLACCRCVRWRCAGARGHRGSHLRLHPGWSRRSAARRRPRSRE